MMGCIDWKPKAAFFQKSEVQRLGLAALVIGVVFLTFLPIAAHDFIVFDDPLFITENPFIKNGITPANIGYAFTRTVAGNWHPLTTLSHMLDCHLWGAADPGLHHLVSALIHAFNAAILFLLLSEMTGALLQSCLVALLFALHPLHVESVAWIAERKDVLCTFFFLLTIRYYYRYTQKPRLKNYSVVLICYLCALLSKPMAVTLFLILILMDHWPLNRLHSFRRAGRRLWIEKLPMILLSSAFSLIALSIQHHYGIVRSLDLLPLQTRLMNAVRSVGLYLEKAFFPFNLSVFYPYPDGMSAFIIFSALLVILILSYKAIRMARPYPFLFVGWYWYLITLLPVIGIIQVGPQAMADRYTYIPLIGIFIIIAWGVPALLGNRLAKTIRVLAVLYIILLGLNTRNQISYWKNGLTLFQHAIKITQNNYLAYNDLGLELVCRNQPDKALPLFLQAVRIKPNHWKAHHNLGVIYMLRGDNKKAAEYFHAAIAINGYAKSKKMLQKIQVENKKRHN